MYKVQVKKGIPMDRYRIQCAISLLKTSANIEHRENLDYLIKEVIKTLRQVKIDLEAKEYAERAEAYRGY